MSNSVGGEVADLADSLTSRFRTRPPAMHVAVQAMVSLINASWPNNPLTYYGNKIAGSDHRRSYCKLRIQVFASMLPFTLN